MVATAGNIKQIEHEKKLISPRKNAKLLKDAQSIADRLAAISEVQLERATAAA